MPLDRRLAEERVGPRPRRWTIPEYESQHLGLTRGEPVQAEGLGVGPRWTVGELLDVYGAQDAPARGGREAQRNTWRARADDTIPTLVEVVDG